MDLTDGEADLVEPIFTELKERLLSLPYPFVVGLTAEISFVPFLR